MEHTTVVRFESRVAKALAACGVSISCAQTVGVAVSGGADSTALLVAMAHLCAGSPTALAVVTVNHNLRPSEESSADIRAVQMLCKALCVPCFCHEIPAGKIIACAKEKKLGIEAAAREFRYQAFNRFVRDRQLSCLALAHHRDDQHETVLMRFLQGSSQLGGMEARRGLFVRPLLDIPRADIEEYLAAQNIAYCVDRTNADTALFRNKLRHSVIPFLDSACPGWRRSLDSLSRNMAQDEALISLYAEQEQARIGWTEQDGNVSFERKPFAKLPPPLQRRLVYRACTAVGGASRVPMRALQVLIDSCIKERPFVWNAAGIEAKSNKTRIVLQKRQKVATECGFFAIIETHGQYVIGPWRCEVQMAHGGMLLVARRNGERPSELFVGSLCFPFVLRSRCAGDSIRAADGSYKAVSDVFSDWKVGALRDWVILVQALSEPGQPLVCIWGEALGFKTYMVLDGAGR